MVFSSFNQPSAFSEFFKFVGMTDTHCCQSFQDFMNHYGGSTFLDGLYRIHNIQDIPKWNELVSTAFPAARGSIQVFGYDWAGRHFAIFIPTRTVVICEPGTGEALDTGLDFAAFHNSEIPQKHDFVLYSQLYEEWKASSYRPFAHNECVGYRTPLFLNGKDEVENLEVSDMDVYWTIMAPLIAE